MRDEGMTATKAAVILRVPRACLFRWQARLRERGLRGPEPDSRRPRNVRRPMREPTLVKAVQVDGGAFEEACKERGILLLAPPAALAEVERARGARAPDACRGVL